MRHGIIGLAGVLLAVSLAVEAADVDYSNVEERIRSLQQKLIAWFEASGQRAAAGSSFRVQASRSEKTALTCNDDELRALLEPAGLWTEVLAPAYHLKNRLLHRPELPGDIRGALDEHSESRVSWRLTPQSLGSDDEGDLT